MTAACVCAEINTRHCPVHGQGETTAAHTVSRLAAVDAILAEIELTGYGMGRGPSQPSIRDLASRARALLPTVTASPPEGDGDVLRRALDTWGAGGTLREKVERIWGERESEIVRLRAKADRLEAVLYPTRTEDA